MEDLNSEFARMESRHATCVALLATMKTLSLKDQRDALLEALYTVNKQLSALEAPASPSKTAPKAKAKPAILPVDLEDDEDDEGDEGDEESGKEDHSGISDDGATALIFRVLRGSKFPMTSKEICEAIQQHKSGVTLPTVMKALSRLRKKGGSGLARRGKRGEYKYSAREVSAA